MVTRLCYYTKHIIAVSKQKHVLSMYIPPPFEERTQKQQKEMSRLVSKHGSSYTYGDTDINTSNLCIANKVEKSMKDIRRKT